ncbi:MAG: hypothetical protein HRU34_20715 [Richelia sp.]|nr:hypothetical protein [Richelia sp.]
MDGNIIDNTAVHDLVLLYVAMAVGLIIIYIYSYYRSSSKALAATSHFKIVEAIADMTFCLTSTNKGVA